MMIETSLGNIAEKKNTIPKDDILNDRDTMPMSSDKCTGCGLCARNCPSKAIAIADGWELDLGKCIFCMDCLMVCPSGCISEIPAPDYSLTREELVVGIGSDLMAMEKPLDEKTRKMFGGSLAIRELDTGSCNACEVDLNAMSNQFYDLHRFGVKISASPRHADAALVTGPMTRSMKDAAIRTCDAIPDPKLIIASGTCAISGGIFVQGDVCGKGIGSILEPQMFIIGCPPKPDRVIRALTKAVGLRH